MSEDPAHGATKIHASNKHSSGGGSKLLLGGVAAAALLGVGYFAYSNLSPSDQRTDTAFNSEYADEYASDPLRAGPIDDDAETVAESASADAPPPASTRASTSSRASTQIASAVPEDTIGVTPASVTTNDSDEIVVTGARHPIWVRTPSERRLSALYPARAQERGREGEARLACTVEDGGSLDCVRVEETPGGFGRAAIRVANTLRHSETLADGSDATGTPVNLRVVFRLPEEERNSRYASR